MSAAVVTPTGACAEATARDAIVVAVLDVPGQRRPVAVTCRGGLQQVAVRYFGGAPIVRVACSTPVLAGK
jgi:hypothetical protein